MERYAVKKLAPLWVQLTVIWPLPATTVVRTGASITGATVVVENKPGGGGITAIALFWGMAAVQPGYAQDTAPTVGLNQTGVSITPVTDSTVGLIYAAIVAAPWTSGCF